MQINIINYNGNGKFEKSNAVGIKWCFTSSISLYCKICFGSTIKEAEIKARSSYFLCITHRNCGLQMHELIPVYESLGLSKQKRSWSN